MATDSNTGVRNDLLSGTALSAIFPAGSIFELRSGAPAGTGNTATGTLLWTFTLGATPWGTPASAAVSLVSTPLTANCAASGTIGHYRLKNSGDTRRVEGTVTATGGGGDFTVDNVVVASGQSFSLTNYTYNLTN